MAAFLATTTDVCTKKNVSKNLNYFVVFVKEFRDEDGNILLSMISFLCKYIFALIHVTAIIINTSHLSCDTLCEK